VVSGYWSVNLNVFPDRLTPDHLTLLFLLLYYITDRTQLAEREDHRCARLLEKIAEAARAGVNFVQLREKDLGTRELESLAREAVERIRAFGSRTRLLINSRTDVAVAVGADGVHLRSKDISAADVRRIWHDANSPGRPLISAACHSGPEVPAAKKGGVDFVVFAPVFGKGNSLEPAAGLDALRMACSHHVPVLALGGVTVENARLCAQAGAKGVAGIRLFQNGNIAEIAAKLRD
jgi:thiamine-phosphate pyrophosphorylase